MLAFGWLPTRLARALRAAVFVLAAAPGLLLIANGTLLLAAPPTAAPSGCVAAWERCAGGLGSGGTLVSPGATVVGSAGLSATPTSPPARRSH